MRKFLLLLLLSSSSFAQTAEKVFDEKTTPPAPDYNNPFNWAALPDKKDFADMVPTECAIKDAQATAGADVFFIYPTIFTRKPTNAYYWNADVNDSILNKEIDESTIRYQATIFNAAGRVYIPRYRQAHIRSYFTKDKLSAQKAFEVAYTDVRKAFQYYLDHYNNGRPIIIAGHSQGTKHAVRLLTEFFDSSPLREKLVAAYLIGGDVRVTNYEMLRPCSDSTATGCYVSWRTYSTDYKPHKYSANDEPLVCTNPLTWRNDTIYAPRSLNKGAVLRDYDKVIDQACDAQVDKSLLRINKPYIRGRAFLRIKNYHKVDYDLFYMNVRMNAITRVNAFLQKEKR
ncbi:MAG: DUF3089 domain-containing protein [Bacteroidia bacterium]